MKRTQEGAASLNTRYESF
uniref:Uncharacterized protein n=1 Tax=Oryza meridionalis TaxID=40149 RepID=A0A0E0D4F0_9ORYZ